MNKPHLEKALPKQAQRRWMRDCLASSALYTALVFASTAMLDSDWPPVLRGALALSPMLPVVWFAWALAAFSRSWDELQRRVVLEAFLIAGATFALGSFAWGWLTLGAGLPELPTIVILPALGALWVVAVPVVAKRYR